MNPANPYLSADAAQSCDRKKEHLDGAPGLPISMAKVGERGTIIVIKGTDEVKRFLAELGFTPGAEVKVVSQASGNMILEIKGSKIAVDRQMAGKILFSPSS